MIWNRSFQFPLWGVLMLLFLGFVGPVPLHRVIREIEDYQNIEAAYTNYTANEVCFSEMQVYQKGDVVPNAGPCEECRCEPPSIVCQMTKCPVNHNGCRTIQRPNHCCPDYNCDCEYGDRVYNDGEKIETPGDCQVCYCKGGEVMCTTIACYTRSDCEPTHVPGQCCPTYQNCPVRDPNGSSEEEKAVPKREMQPWLLTKMATQTAPHVPETSWRDTLTTVSEINQAENLSTTVHEHLATSPSPQLLTLNSMEEVVFTRVEQNDTQDKSKQEVLEQNKQQDGIVDTSTDFQTEEETTTEDETVSATDRPKIAPEKILDSNEKETTILENYDVTEMSDLKVSLGEQDTFLTTNQLEKDTITTIKPLIESKPLENYEETPNNFETTTKDVEPVTFDLPGDNLQTNKDQLNRPEKLEQSPESNESEKEYHSSPSSEDVEHTTKNSELKEFDLWEKLIATTNDPSSETVTEKELKPSEDITKIDMFPGKLHIGELLSNDELSSFISTNTIDDFTTVAPKLTDNTKQHLNEDLKVQEITTETVSSTDTIETTTLRDVELKSSIVLEKDLLKDHDDTKDNMSSSENVVQVINKTSDIKLDTDKLDSITLNTETTEEEKDEGTTQKTFSTSADSEEIENSAVIDVVEPHNPDETIKVDFNRPPILELNSHVPFLQLGEDSSEEVMETEKSTETSTSRSILKKENIENQDDNKDADDSSEELTTKYPSTKKSEEIKSIPEVKEIKQNEDSEVISVSTPVIPLTPGDLKALAEFMIQGKITPVDGKNDTHFEPNQWLQGNLTSEEKMASILSAANVSVNKINTTEANKKMENLSGIETNEKDAHVTEDEITTNSPNFEEQNTSSKTNEDDESTSRSNPAKIQELSKIPKSEPQQENSTDDPNKLKESQTLTKATLLNGNKNQEKSSPKQGAATVNNLSPRLEKKTNLSSSIV